MYAWKRKSKGLSELDKFTATTLRGPKRGVYEQLLAAKLISANRSKPLQRIRYISEAAWFAKEKAENLGMELVETLYKVSVALDSVERDKHWDNRYTYFMLYPVPWPFEKTQENFERYVKPWLKSFPNYYSAFVTSVGSYRIFKTRILCSQCKTVLLDIRKEDKPKHEDLIKKKFKVKFENRMLISQEAYDQMKEFVKNVTMPFSYETYEPPSMQRMFFKCPKCEKQIVIWKEVYLGSHRLVYGRMRSQNSPNEAKLELEDYDVLSEGWKWRIFFEASQYLTREGYKQLVNSFVSWADPQITEIEAKISTLITPQTFIDLYKATEEREEAEAEEVGDSLGPRE